MSLNLVSYSCPFSLNQTQVYITLFYPCVSMITTTHRISLPRSLLGAWARGPGGSGDTGFEVLDLRTSGHFRFKSKLEDSLLKALNHPNLQSLTLLQEQVNAIRNVVEKQKWLDVLETRTSNPVSPEFPLSPEPPGPCAQTPRRLWGREWTLFR